MKAQEMPISLVALLVIMIVGVAIALIFAFSAMSETKEQSSSLVNISQESIDDSLKPVEEMETTHPPPVMNSV